MSPLQSQAAKAVKALLTEVLNHRTHVERSFDALRAPVDCYTDDEIRMFLLEAGAKRVTRDNGSEWWYLLSRDDERLERRSD